MAKEKIIKELTKAELEVMQIIWAKNKVLAREVLDEMPEPKPAYNTVSTVIRVLEKKGASIKPVKRSVAVRRWSTTNWMTSSRVTR